MQDHLSLVPKKSRITRQQDVRAKGPLTVFNACTYFTDRMAGVPREARACPRSHSQVEAEQGSYPVSPGS